MCRYMAPEQYTNQRKIDEKVHSNSSPMDMMQLRTESLNLSDEACSVFSSRSSS